MDTIEQLGGPVIGVGLSIERGMKDIYEGEVQRGIEAMAPAAVRNGLKSFRLQLKAQKHAVAIQ